MGACKVMKIVLKVELYCLKCKFVVLKAITKLMGIDKIEIDMEKSTVTVTGEVDAVAVVQQVRKLGKMVEIVTVGEDKKEEVVKPSNPLECCKTCQHISVKVVEYGGCAIM
ncbi:heavy metal-associated isoprenylated plant protein 45-like [Nymphaea colorata]|nr:heavy metal-associated isoprenylated plant protein 45-like [Nymphaea colorata]